MTEHSSSILITGASGGFGMEFARQLEPLGYSLLLHGRDEERLQRIRHSLNKPQRHRCITADLSHAKGIHALLESMDESIYGLVNNAGFGLWGTFERMPIADQLNMLRTDLEAPMILTHALLPQLKSQQGFIINVSSLAGEYPLPWMSGYAAAKAGLTYWSEALRTELKHELRIVTLAPGPSPTGFRRISGMPHATGNFFRTPATLIVRHALQYLQRGGGYCVPGWRHHLLWLLQKTIPRRFGLHIMAGQMQRES